MKLTYRTAYSTQFVLKTDEGVEVSTMVTFTNSDIQNNTDPEQAASLCRAYAANVVSTLVDLLTGKTLEILPLNPEDEAVLFDNIWGLIEDEWAKARGTVCVDCGGARDSDEN